MKKWLFATVVVHNTVTVSGLHHNKDCNGENKQFVKDLVGADRADRADTSPLLGTQSWQKTFHLHHLCQYGLGKGTGTGFVVVNHTTLFIDKDKCNFLVWQIWKPYDRCHLGYWFTPQSQSSYKRCSCTVLSTESTRPLNNMLLALLPFLSSVSAHGGMLWPPIRQDRVGLPIEQFSAHYVSSNPKVRDPKSGRVYVNTKTWLTDQELEKNSWALDRSPARSFIFICNIYLSNSGRSQEAQSFLLKK